MLMIGSCDCCLLAILKNFELLVIFATAAGYINSWLLATNDSPATPTCVSKFFYSYFIF